MTPARQTAWRCLAALVAVLGCLPGAASRADPPSVSPGVSPRVLPVIPLRTGEHPGFGRLVLDLPSNARPMVLAAGDAIDIRLPGRVISLPAHLPRAVLASDAVGGGVHMVLRPGTRTRSYGLPGRFVIDLGDPTSVVAPAPPHAPASFRQTSEARNKAVPIPAAAPAFLIPPGQGSGAREAPPQPAPAIVAADPAAQSSPAQSSQAGFSQAGSIQARPASAHPAVAERGPAAAEHAGPPSDVAAGMQPAAAGSETSPGEGGAGMPAVETAPDTQVAEEPLPDAALLPVPPRAGIAAFRRGGFGLIVVDADAPADPALWHAVRGLEGAQIQNLPDATLVSVALPPAEALSVTRTQAGWRLAMGAESPPGNNASGDKVAGDTRPAGTDIEPVFDKQRLALPARLASRVISVADPVGGGMLLVGTLRDEKQAAAPAAAPGADGAPGGDGTVAGVGGDRMFAGRALPALGLLPTWRGVAVEPLADSLDMRPSATGFLIDLGAQRGSLGPVADGAATTSQTVGESRLFDLPQLPVRALSVRLQAAADAVAAAPARGRGAAQIHLAEAMVALGLGAEAQAVLRLAASTDGRVAARPDALALGSAAALLAGRLDETEGIEAPSVQDAAEGADEIALWRALRQARLASEQGTSHDAAARTIARHLDLLLSYPAPLRDRLLPLAAETMLHPEPRAAARLLAAAGPVPGLEYVRALNEAEEGHPDAALVRLDRVAAGEDRRDHARAAIKAVELRLAAGQLTPAQAADAMDALVAAWRGDDMELAARLRTAELRVQAGQPRAALAMLRETASDALMPTWSEPRRADLHRRLAATFQAALADDEKKPLPPLDFLAMVEENADLMPPDADGARFAQRVADRLAALDLPQRTEEALRKLIDGAPAGAGRAALGNRLAALQLQQGDTQAALVTLSASTAESLPPALVAERTMVFARASAARGDLAAATGALAALDTPEADALRAKLLEQGGKWHDAAAALSSQLARTLSPDGPLGAEQSALVVHLASVAAQTGEDATLAALRRDILPRMAGHDADLVRMLTLGPVQSIADLPRAAREVAFAKLVTAH